MTEPYIHAVSGSDLDELLGDVALFIKSYFLDLREVLLGFFIEIDETDDDMLTIAFQIGAHLLKDHQMVGDVVFLIQEDRIVAPDDILDRDLFRKFDEGIHDFLLVRDVGLDILAIGRDRHVPVHPIFF